jgi:hypothetical protein
MKELIKVEVEMCTSTRWIFLQQTELQALNLFS